MDRPSRLGFALSGAVPLLPVGGVAEGEVASGGNQCPSKTVGYARTDRTVGFIFGYPEETTCGLL